MIIVIRGNYIKALNGRKGTKLMGFNAIGFVYVLYVIFNPYYIDGTPSGARVLAGILIGLWAALGTVLFRGAGWYREGEPLVPERARRRSELWWGVFGLV